ncbi:hypothetical protein JW906_02120 [bacterium]|nr:hypothetical protein [bacterium]
MKMRHWMPLAAAYFCLAWLSCGENTRGGGMTFITETIIQKTVKKLTDACGVGQAERIASGVRRTAAFWQEADGDAQAFAEFCGKAFISDLELLRKTAERCEKNFESLDGHFLEIGRDLSEPMQLDQGPMLPVDYLFAQYSPWAHLSEDLFKTGVGFTVLLNFPAYTLKERLELGPSWSREQWAWSRLADRFDARVPAEVRQGLTRAYVDAEDYISNYNIHMHRLVTPDGRRPFPEGLRLISHWGLRDELKGRYADPDGLEKQEMIYEVMRKIILQEIPASVINNPDVDWKLSDNSVAAAGGAGQGSPSPAPEPNTRYVHLLNIFHAERLADPFTPSLPTKMDRRFEKDRQIPENTIESLFQSILTSEAFRRTAALIEKRLGRPLRPFDIWYNGFKPAGLYPEQDLDLIVGRRYPDIQAFERDIPRILRTLEFGETLSDFLGSKIVVDPARGSGHAQGAARRADNAHLRTRVPAGGMNYKGYNIACHELGHCVEQVISLNRIDHTLLAGIPNTAFTEAFAFVFQKRDLELLGLTKEDPLGEHLGALNDLWATAEIAGVALVDMKVWRWMYEHPEAGAGETRQAVIRIAKEVWNAYFAPVLGVKDEILLAVYSHMIDNGLYLPDYPLGHIIAFQIEEYLKGRPLGSEMDRMCRLGSITPDAWMQAAVGTPISTGPMLQAAGKALDQMK